MALCVIYPVPGLLHSKGKEGNLKQCQPGTILPPELGLQDLQEPQRTVITNYSWLASVVAYERISFTRLRREWDSNPQSCRPDGNKSDALTTRPRRYACSLYKRNWLDSRHVYCIFYKHSQFQKIVSKMTQHIL